MNFSFKKNIIIIVIAAVLALGVGGTVIGVNVYNSPSNRISRYLGAAERYLSEMNYEQAIIEFQNILEIEPMNVDAYLGLAEAYIGLGDTEKALEILREGLEITGDERLQNMIDELTKPEESEPVESSNSSSERNTGREPVESSLPEHGSMGFVTIAEKEYDIATTTHLNLKENFWVREEDVEQIGKLVNLTYLDLSKTSTDDISSLAGLTKLEKLYLSSNYIRDLTPLAGLTNLTELDLSHNGYYFSDISPLAGLTNLTYLNLGNNNEISDFTPLAGLTNLTYLDLSSTKIKDLTPLAGLTNLTELYLGYNNLSVITPLAGLTNLTYLDLQANGEFEDVTALGNLKKLTRLNLPYYHPISDENLAWLREQLPDCEVLLFN